MNHNNRRNNTGVSSAPSFSIGSLGAPPDLFAGFRKELADIEAQEQLIEQRAIQMASKIEQADASTMFGGDYSEATQYAQWMTDRLWRMSSILSSTLQSSTKLNTSAPLVLERSRALLLAMLVGLLAAQNLTKKTGTWTSVLTRTTRGHTLS